MVCEFSPAVDGRIEGVHLDVDDLALAARGSRLGVLVLDGHVASRPNLP